MNIVQKHFFFLQMEIMYKTVTSILKCTQDQWHM